MTNQIPPEPNLTSLVSICIDLCPLRRLGYDVTVHELVMSSVTRATNHAVISSMKLTRNHMQILSVLINTHSLLRRC